MVENTIDPCCGCIKLRTGCLIIGYFRLVAEIILNSYVVRMAVPSMVEAIKEESGGFKYFLIVVGVLILLYLALSIVACIVLLVGLHTDRHDCVAAYVRYARVCIYITLTFCIREFIWPTSTQDFTLFRIGFILLLLQAYFRLVIYCHSESMNEKPLPATTAEAPVPVPDRSAAMPNNYA